MFDRIFFAILKYFDGFVYFLTKLNAREKIGGKFQNMKKIERVKEFIAPFLQV